MAKAPDTRSLPSLQKQVPYLFAVTYSLAVSWTIALLFPNPPPRIMDLYLIGIAFACARWSVAPALVIYLTSLLFGAWILPPNGSFLVSDGHDIYRMVSYGVTSIVVMMAIKSAKRND